MAIIQAKLWSGEAVSIPDRACMFGDTDVLHPVHGFAIHLAVERVDGSFGGLVDCIVTFGYDVRRWMAENRHPAAPVHAEVKRLGVAAESPIARGLWTDWGQRKIELPWPENKTGVLAERPSRGLR